MIRKVADNVWKFNVGSNAYLLKTGKNIVIDTGDRGHRDNLKKYFDKVLDPEKVDIVIFTHLHYDHIGNFDFFSNAAYYASEESIKDYEENPVATILSNDMAEKFRGIKLNPAKDMHGLRMIKTPGHTNGSMCIFYEKEKILFSGDTIFDKGIGRTDLPTSNPEKMQESIMKLVDINHKILCPGHDY